MLANVLHVIAKNVVLCKHHGSLLVLFEPLKFHLRIDVLALTVGFDLLVGGGVYNSLVEGVEIRMLAVQLVAEESLEFLSEDVEALLAPEFVLAGLGQLLRALRPLGL